VLIDENQYTINDAAFALSMTLPTKMVDWPGTRHNFGATIAHADGHAEIHHWQDARTKGEGLSAPPDHSIQLPDDVDIEWLQQRTSTKAF
jgi:prepilin-type processing-associated H-X9-DG protein